MKKVLSLVLVLMLCLAMSAMAVPSSWNTEYTIVAPFDISVDVSEAALAELDAQYDQLSAVGKEAYFGGAAASEIDAISNGNLVSLFPITVSGYDASMGDATITITNEAFGVLEAGQKVAVAVGTPNGIENGLTVYEWVVFEGIADGNGNVEVTFDSATLAKIEVEGALVAIYA